MITDPVTGSVPSSSCPPGQRVEIRLDSKLVRIYHRGRLVNVHQRQPKGGRAQHRIVLRLNSAGFEETCRLEDFDWSASITLDRRLLDAGFSIVTKVRANN